VVSSRIMATDHFAHKAASYEQNPDRVDNVQQIATAMLEAVRFESGMQIMDFGSGTGLLLERIAPHVAKVSALDVSASMLDQLRPKLPSLACEVELIQLDLESATLDRRFDGIISSMTLHHIRDVPALFEKLHAMLHPGGFIALADLDREDGSFHTEDTHVEHPGFGRSEIERLATRAGFLDVQTRTASRMRKHGREYPVFLLTARRS
jgi:cyclopropane fatty-acyl-phospholipid synthase-like methyltransferase